MANSPVDKGNDFIQSGMTLITERNADYWLSRYKDWKDKKDSVTNQLNSILNNVDK
jgi:phage-related tail protein